MSRIKTLFVYLKCVLSLVLLRSYGNIIYDLAHKYKGKVSLADLRCFEKLSIKAKKKELDLSFLKTCQAFNVFPKFVCFPLPNTSQRDTFSIRKKLLRSNIIKSSREKRKLLLDLDVKRDSLQSIFSSVDWLILTRSLKKNVDNALRKVSQNHQKKIKSLTRNTAVPFKHEETVTNLSTKTFTDFEFNLLKNGLDFSIRPPKLSKSDIFSTFETINFTMKSKLQNPDNFEQLKMELGHLANNYVSTYRPSQTDLKKHHILRGLKNNKAIIILRPDKGNGVVILDREVYNNSCLGIINDQSKFKHLPADPTISREAKLQRFLRKLRSKKVLDKDTYCSIFPKGSQPARFYGLPKLHKPRGVNQPPPFRPIVSSVGTYNYNLAKYLCSILNPIIPDTYTVKDSFSFVNEFNSLTFSDKFLISFDVESLFTNIPLDETIDIAINLIFKNKPSFPICKSDLKQLFSFATSQTHFLFNGNFYDQVDGVAMGSPLAPVLANLFMGFHEQSWLTNYNGPKVLYYRRYVDDTLCLFDKEEHAMSFFNFINSQHPNIKFTFEKELNGKISFLDVLINKSTGKFKTSIFHKKTYTGLLTNFLSFTSFKYKLGLIKTLVDRTFKINNTSSGFHSDLNNLINTLKRNSFPAFVIDNVVKRYQDKVKNNQHSSDSSTVNAGNVRYFKLPFIGQFSTVTQSKINILCKRFCKDLNIKLVFTSFKIKNFFQNKDTIPMSLKSSVVYKFTCARCGSRYIGETTRHLAARYRKLGQPDKILLNE